MLSMWWSEGNSVEWIRFSHLYVSSGVEFSLAGLHSKHLDPVKHQSA